MKRALLCTIVATLALAPAPIAARQAPNPKTFDGKASDSKASDGKASESKASDASKASSDSLAGAAAKSHSEAGFTPLFDGKTLNGWTIVDKRGEGYGVKDGMIFCALGGGGKLMTEREFSDFVLRFEFRMPTLGANNGIGIRAPLDGDAAYNGMEIQILDEQTALSGKWGQLRDAQFHGSIYDVVPAKRGAMKPVGNWNREEIVAHGRQITVTLNDQVILDANLDDVKDPAVLAKHPGLQRPRGHIGLLGHNDYIEFRNIRIKEL